MKEAFPPVTVLEFDDVPSTQDIARAWLESHQNDTRGTVWAQARTQSKGRGRLGREWRGVPEDAALYVSAGFFCPASLRSERPLISLIAGLALFRAIEELGLETERLFLKWPNDLFGLRSDQSVAKIGGVLCEGVRGEGIVVGWGVNLAAHPEGLSQAAMHLGEVVQAPSPRALCESLRQVFAVELLAWFSEPVRYRVDLLKTLEEGPMERLWGRRGLVRERDAARAVGLGNLGELLVQLESTGERLSIPAGDFSFLPNAFD